MVIMNRPHHHRAWLDLAMFENATDGRVLEMFLRNLGYEARTYDDKVFRHFLFLRPPRLTWRVQVRRDDYAEASKLLQMRPPAVLNQAIHCPSCGSLHVNYPQMTRKFILPTVLLHLGIIFRVIEHECYCENCHEMWNLPEKSVASSQPHAIKPASF